MQEAQLLTGPSTTALCSKAASAQVLRLHAAPPWGRWRGFGKPPATAARQVHLQDPAQQSDISRSCRSTYMLFHL
jgi:hypothetical protein